MVIKTLPQKASEAWTLGREIGHGAYGTVHLATGPKGQVAAVKVCRREAMDRDRYERELRGARLYKSIQTDEGLVRMLGVFEHDWGFSAVMELADDEFGENPATSAYRPKTLARVIEGEKALPLKGALELGISLTKGLVTLQRHHLLHRDVKPGNVIYVKGRPVLADPGLLVDEAQAASLVGTPGYVPPENFTGAGGDVYSLGLTLMAASFGRPVEELDRGPALEADTDNPMFPFWWRILNKATNPDAARRYQSAKALLKDLLSLRRKMALSVYVRKIPLVALLVFLALVVFFLFRSDLLFKWSSIRYLNKTDPGWRERQLEAVRALKGSVQELRKDIEQSSGRATRPKRQDEEK